MRRTIPPVYGADRSLLDLPLDRDTESTYFGSASKWSRALHEAIDGSDMLICKGRVPLAGSMYRVSLWRGRGSTIVTVARRLRPWGKGPIVRDPATLKVLKQEVLRDEAHDAVAEALWRYDLTSWDLSDRLFEELIDDAITQVLELTCSLEQGAKTAVDRMWERGELHGRLAE